MSTYVSKGRNYTMVAHIYDGRLEEMAADWVDDKAKETARLARANLIATNAVRTGALLRSINKRRRNKVGGFIAVTVVAGAGHAVFVHQGTMTPIVAKNPKGMSVPRFKGAAPNNRVRRHTVRGQRANPFLSAAMQEALVGTRSPFRLP